jgi:tRNA threonylcarbamoyl adenosine modification protein YeaZ
MRRDMTLANGLARSSDGPQLGWTTVLALVIDTSSAAVTAGVVDIDAGVTVLAEAVTVDVRAHGELLAPEIKKSLDGAGKTPADLEAIIAGVGPGPFTGLRVGLVTAAAMSDALQIPAYGVCSLDGIAATIRHDGPLLVAGDARRKEVYWARYLYGIRDGEPDVAKPADLVAGATAMAGAGARLYADVLGLPLLDNDFPTVAGLATVAAGRARTHADPDPLTPLYLRRPDATPLTARAAR